MLKRKQSLSLAVLVAFLFLLVAGCGGSNSPASSPQQPAPVPVSSPTNVSDNNNQSNAPSTPATEDKRTVSSTPTSQSSNQTVYITNTGTKYHVDGCRSLSKSKIPISLNDAKAKGYTPCGICHPPQ